MNPKIFISKSDTGWQEVEIPEKFRRYSHDALVRVVHKFIDRNSCKGLLITENPNPFERNEQEKGRLSA
jgi:hypothetical protein